ncbi:MAG TPA: cyclic nucleotide-binding domain-containing protein, partial [Ktedonobacterales bacterium]
FPADFAIVEQGERNASLYLIIAGHVQVIVEDAHGTQRTLQTLGPGQFFGAEALAGQRAHATAFVAADTVTCLTLASQAPTAFDGRGEAAGQDDATSATHGEGYGLTGLICMDVATCLERKVAALAAHRSQFAIEPELLALAPVWQLMRREYFEPVVFGAPSAAHGRRMDDTITLGARAERLALPA